MKTKTNSIMLCLIVIAVSTLALAKSKADVRDVTGCLSKGDSAREFLLTGNDGSTWEVKSSRVALGKHVGHLITATGVVSHAKMHNMKEDSKAMGHDTGMSKNNSEHGHLTITDLQHVSDSCSK